MGCTSSRNASLLEHPFLTANETEFLRIVREQDLSCSDTFVVNFGWMRGQACDFHEFTVLQAACHRCFQRVVTHLVDHDVLKSGSGSSSTAYTPAAVVAPVRHFTAEDLREMLQKKALFEAVETKGLRNKAARHRMHRRTNKGMNALACVLNCAVPTKQQHSIPGGIANKKRAIIKLLLDAGADPNSVDDRGLSPLSYVSPTMEESEIVELLLKGGADPHTKDDHGLTLLEKCPARVSSYSKTRSILCRFLGRSPRASSSPHSRRNSNSHYFRPDDGGEFDCGRSAMAACEETEEVLVSPLIGIDQHNLTITVSQSANSEPSVGGVSDSPRSNNSSHTGFLRVAGRRH